MATAVASPAGTETLAPQEQLLRELEHSAQKSAFVTRMRQFLSQYPSEPATEYLITIDQLDFLVDTGRPGPELLDIQFDYKWEVLMLTYIAWWKHLRIIIDNHPVTADHVDQKEVELRAAISAYFVAQRPNFEDAAVEFVRQYRIWTRSICAVIKKEWPSVDWIGLEMLV